MKIAINYTIFAIFATIANIGTQDISTRLYDGPYHLILAVFAGTGIGLVVKYFLDKKYIFKYQTTSASHDGKTFILYTVMGIVTTVIFWGFEFGFHYLYETKEMRYLGAVIGLGIGYISKYYLDKRFVFVNKQA